MTKSPKGTGVFLPSYSPINKQDSDRNGTTYRNTAATRGYTQPECCPFSVALQNKLQELMMQRSYCPSTSQTHNEGMLRPTSPFSSVCASGSSFISTDMSFGAFSEPSVMGHCHSSSSNTHLPGQDFAPILPVASPPSRTMQYINVTSNQELQGMLLLQQCEVEVDAAILNLLAWRQQLAAQSAPAVNPPPAAMLSPAPAAAFPGPLPVSQAPVTLGPHLEFVPYGTHMHAAPVVPVGANAAAQLQLAQLQAQQQQLLGFEQQLQLELQVETARLLALV